MLSYFRSKGWAVALVVASTAAQAQVALPPGSAPGKLIAGAGGYHQELVLAVPKRLCGRLRAFRLPAGVRVYIDGQLVEPHVSASCV